MSLCQSKYDCETILFIFDAGGFLLSYFYLRELVRVDVYIDKLIFYSFYIGI